jgi:hypothetical protein
MKEPELVHTTQAQIGSLGYLIFVFKKNVLQKEKKEFKKSFGFLKVIVYFKSK